MSEYAESIRRLEEKIAYLERHVTEQDKAMMEMADDLTRLGRELKALRERDASGAQGGGGEEAMPDERPPHY
ncbi:MAG: SlyX family protein [Verrucomicrobia bacterium]|nr:SlyX family protein [Verrucomicrobiota bacterium]